MVERARVGRRGSQTQGRQVLAVLPCEAISEHGAGFVAKRKAQEVVETVVILQVLFSACMPVSASQRASQTERASTLTINLCIRTSISAALEQQTA